MAASLLLAACQRGKRTSRLEQWLPDPEKIISAGSELSLTPQQQSAIEVNYRAARPRYDSLQREAQLQTARLEAILKQHPTPVDSADAALERLLAIEGEIKHLRMAVYIFSKNQLTPAQLEKILRHK